MTNSSIDISNIRALLFDVFGTVVDWRTCVAREAEIIGRRNSVRANWIAFADDWRGLYQPMMSKVREGRIDYVVLDILHRMGLDELIAQYGLQDLTEAELDDLNRVWHRLDPWPDVVSGLTQLKQDRIIATCSNGHIALMVNLAKHAGLPWDMILGAEIANHYKPEREAYLRSAAALALEPAQCMMVAAHEKDLVAAKSFGLATAFVHRPMEFGDPAKADTMASKADLVATDFNDLARQLSG